jgi:hypothetical protein
MSKGLKTFAEVHIVEAHQKMANISTKRRKMKSIWNERNM